jgi:hypothetical protein
MKAVSSGPIQIMIRYRTLAELAWYFSFFSMFYLYVYVLTFRPSMPFTRLSIRSDIDSVEAGVNCLICVYLLSVCSKTKASSCLMI